nr:cyclic nucleotide-binding domain-containing protein [Spirochaetaceae bacterium]
RHDLQMALSELVINGIEHGNCGITYQEKTDYMMKGYSMHELILEKNKDDKTARKSVRLDWDFGDREIKFTINDDGQGFDVQGYIKKAKNDKADNLHGRGIILAQSVSDKILYNNKGNQVSLVFNHEQTIEQDAPLGFAEEEFIHVSKGDVLLRAGEFADCLYYICSGSFTVFHKETPVGRITPADIFMGEMAFLLNNTRSATVIAREPGKVIKIPRKSFITVVKEFPQYSIFLAKLLAQKLVKANEISRSSLMKISEETNCE